MNNESLVHYGILGMRWGVRRNQAQLERARSSSKTNPDKAIKAKRKQTAAARRHLSDGDLRKAIERLQQEKKLKDLTNEDVAPGRTTASNIMKQIGKTAITTAGAAVATYTIKAAMEGRFDIKEAAKFIRPKK